MKKLVSKPYLLFWMAVPMILLSGFAGSTSNHNISINGTEVAISQMNISILLAIVFEVVGIGHWLLKKQQKRVSVFLNSVHALATFMGVLLLGWYTFLMAINAQDFTFTYSLALTLILSSQLLFPFILWLGFVKSPKLIEGTPTTNRIS